jgi:hypothetical protein
LRLISPSTEAVSREQRCLDHCIRTGCSAAKV